MVRLILVLALSLLSSDAQADVRRVWAVGDGDKVERDEQNHPASARNAVWDGRVVRLFAARNEIIAFQVIVEADGDGIGQLSVRLPELVSATDRITYQPPGADPTNSVGRPIQIFTTNYMLVSDASNAPWVFERGSPAAPSDPTGWKPVQLVPENARRGRGGMPVSIKKNENQAVWIEIYVETARAPGIYRGTISVQTDHTRRSLPVELQVFDFALPDENSMHAMLFYTSEQAELYHGRNMDAEYQPTRAPPSRRARARLRRETRSGNLGTIFRLGFHKGFGVRGSRNRCGQRHCPADVLRPRLRLRRPRLSLVGERFMDDVSA